MSINKKQLNNLCLERKLLNFVFRERRNKIRVRVKVTIKKLRNFSFEVRIII